MQSVNQKSNTFQSILGFFFQSAHVPYKVIDALECLGLSISTDAINMAVCPWTVRPHYSHLDLVRSRMGDSLLRHWEVG